MVIRTLKFIINCFQWTVHPCVDIGKHEEKTVLQLIAKLCAARWVVLEIYDFFFQCSDESVRAVMKLFFHRERNGRKKGKSIVIS